MISGDGNINFIANGKQYFVSTGHKNYDQVLQELKLGDDADTSVLVNLVEQITQVKESIDSNEDGRISVVGNCVYYIDEDGEKEELHGVVVQRLLSFIKNNLPTGPIVNFIKKCMNNPDYHVIAESGLFAFLDHKGFPICSDGDFLAYKAVTEDLKDKRTGRFDNSPGSVVKEKRRRVNTNRDEGCSTGLHAGTLEYAQGFGSGTDKIVLVKINPSNVVSVPKDCQCQKLRCCEYHVLMIYDHEFSIKDDLVEGWDNEDSDDYYDDDYYDEDLEDDDEL